MEELKLNISFEEFEDSIKKLSAEFEALSVTELHKDFPELDLRSHIQSLEQKTDDFLSKAFNSKANKFYQSFQDRYKNKYGISGVEITPQMRVNELKELTRRVIQILKEILQMVSICDLLKMDSQINLKQRETMTIKEKQEFLLEKLYEIRDNQFYSLVEIFEGNGLKKNNPNEVYEIAGSLSKQGLIDTVNGAGAMITIEGRIYVEEILKKRQTLLSSFNSTMVEFGGNSLELTTLKKNLKNRITEGIDDKLFDKIDVLLNENGQAKNLFYSLRGRFSSLTSNKIHGIITQEHFDLQTNRIRYDLITMIEKLSMDDLKIQKNHLP